MYLEELWVTEIYLHGNKIKLSFCSVSQTWRNLCYASVE